MSWKPKKLTAAMPFIPDLGWDQVGKEVNKYPTWRLLCYVRVNGKVFAFMCNHLGTVKQKNDGRWEWFRRRQSLANDLWDVSEASQGVCGSMDDAMAMVEDGLKKDFFQEATNGRDAN